MFGVSRGPAPAEPCASAVRFRLRAAACIAGVCYAALSPMTLSAATRSIAYTLQNPAMMLLAQPGLTTEINVSTTFGTAAISTTSAANPNIPNIAAYGDSGNMNRPLTLPTSYSAYRFGDWAVGLTTHSPYTLETMPNNPWAGMFYATDTKIYTENFTPQVAYQLTSWLSVGAGFQIQGMSADLSQGFPQSTGSGELNFKGRALSFGYVLGVNFYPTPRTVLGVGYRSALDQKLEGTVTRAAVPAFAAPAVSLPASFTFPMPDHVTVTLVHQLTDTWGLLGQFEWLRWSRFGTLPFDVTPKGVFGLPTALYIPRRNAWAVTTGAEYRWSADLALRAGVRYDRSAMWDQVRSPATPVADTIRALIGFTYEINDKLSLDVSYVHAFVRHVPINIAPGYPGYTRYQGTFSGEATLGGGIVSVGLRYYWGPLGSGGG